MSDNEFADGGGLMVPCPKCCEARADFLVWLDDEETVRCLTCGHEFKPGE